MFDLNRNEAYTRTELIDTQLARSGWSKLRKMLLEEVLLQVAMPGQSYGKDQFADYVLLGSDGKMERADATLDDFKYKTMPRVAISVDMLDTGVDVPAIQGFMIPKSKMENGKFHAFS